MHPDACLSGESSELQILGEPLGNFREILFFCFKKGETVEAFPQFHGGSFRSCCALIVTHPVAMQARLPNPLQYVREAHAAARASPTLCPPPLVITHSSEI